MIPGEIIAVGGDIELNAGQPTVTITVSNTGDRPVQVGSHYHFAETNAGLSFEREKARGMRLDIPAGTAVRFEPGQARSVTLIPLSGKREVYGFRQQVMAGCEPDMTTMGRKMKHMPTGVVLAAAFAFAGAASAQEDPPIDCENAQVQAEMNSCAYQDFEAADKELNAQYKKTRAAMVEMDSSYEADQRGAEKALLKAQRAWIDYRDGHCEAYGFEAHLGSMEPMLIYGCQAELTRSRTKELKALAEGMGN